MFVRFSLFAFFLAAVFVQKAAAEVSVAPYGNQLIYSVKVDALIPTQKRIENKTFVHIALKGVPTSYSAVYYRPGVASLPVVRFYYEGDVDVNFVEDPDVHNLPTSLEKFLVAPSQISRAKLPGSRAPFTLDQKFYSTNAYFPATPYYVEDAGMYRGRRRKLITLFPVSYNPVTNSFKFRPTFVVRTSRPVVEAPVQPTMALIVGAKFAKSPALEAYARFRQQQGFRVVGIPIGRDASSPQQVRAKIKQLFLGTKGALQYAMIIGDLEDVPAPKGAFIGGPTDHYYRSIDTDDYMNDINGPDISVGRFPAADEAQLQAMVEKTIRYQTTPAAQAPWLARATWLATSDRYEVAEGTHNYVIGTYAARAGYTGLFPSNPMVGGDQLYPVTHRAPAEAVAKVIQSGTGWLQYSGHGTQQGWEQLRPNDVTSINSDALPFVVSNSCLTGAFETSESFAETWMRHPKGAVFYWGSVDLTYWDEDDILERRQVDGMFADRRTFGEITNFALSEVWRHYGGQGRSAYYWETYTSFGDPSVEFRFRK